MGKLEDIEKRINERMAEIDRRIGGSQAPVDPAPKNASMNPPDVPISRGGAREVSGSFSLAPLNPDFLGWADSRATCEGCFGLVPSPCDFSFMRQFSVSTRDAETLPRSYDLRKLGQLPPVRNQGPYGTCWAHAALASLESSLLKECGETVDLSENNLVNLSGFDNGYSDGGFASMPAAYLLRWSGPVLERDDPYGRPGASRSLPPILHLQNIRIIPQMQNASDTSRIKKTVMELGAVWMGYIHDKDASAYNENTASFYLSGEPSPDSGGHAVAVVGWDDDYSASRFSVTPPGNGAWIVRNSWGTDWGDGGYFYVSYHDMTFGRMEPGYAYSGADVVTNYDAVLQYDPMGLVTALGGGERMSAANVFRAERPLDIGAVGFYALSPNTSYCVRIYVGCSPDCPDSGMVAAEVPGVCEWAGYLTVKLPAAVAVSAGQKFSVVVEMVSSAAKFPIGVELAFPRLGTSKADANPGESFVRQSGGSWCDMTRIDRTCNFCCKAYVNYR